MSIGSLRESPRPAFATTQWTAVLQAAGGDGEDARQAFSRLYVDYWCPLHLYIRRRGYSPADAEDIAQDFFVHLIEYQSLAGLEREGAKFRTYLLRLLNNFLANEWHRARAQKRGGGEKAIALDLAGSEARFSEEPADNETPEVLFERQWVFTMLARVLEGLRAECAVGGKEALFADLRLHLQGDRQGPSYATIAARHDLSEGAVKVAAHRLRQRYGEMLRAEIARTVGGTAEVDEELRHFIAVSVR